ncbi:hypothetical protein TELCIR_13440 [Teladorsagia circumcincta]|uniref:Fibrinogen C-terminal domain-containing protein n=1 Tax=Teladorsagia circumcincta TaxID=45464 RepID=A0A2G9U5D1_TELCI|nr:hypothetical protein TELCIR_13440 [Teladorsagia circumcincta]
MTDCADWYTAGYRDDGEYSIVLNGEPHKVYCDMNTADGGWVVFQRRVDGNDSFWDHNWNEYRNGFGAMGPNERKKTLYKSKIAYFEQPHGRIYKSALRTSHARKRRERLKNLSRVPHSQKLEKIEQWLKAM